MPTRKNLETLKLKKKFRVIEITYLNIILDLWKVKFIAFKEKLYFMSP